MGSGARRPNRSRMCVLTRRTASSNFAEYADEGVTFWRRLALASGGTVRLRHVDDEAV